ncbi:MAG: hypothetical protein HOB59_00050 [Gammaproteobacteria bacterium]|nr:hypothetical protein [Gammaproteobacteria bacterium]
MKKFIGFIVIILLFAFAPLQHIWPIDYSSKAANILIFLGNLQVIILTNLTNLVSILLPMVSSLLNIIGVLVSQVIQILISLPYDNINPWYVLISLFITAYFFEKFRVINNEISKLNKIILKQSGSSNSVVENPYVDNSDEITKLNSKADSIMKLLIEINNAADIFKSTGSRSKKIRREILPEPVIDNSEEVISFSNLDKSDNNISQDIRDENRAKDEEQLMRLRKDLKSLEQKESDKSEATDEVSQDIRDENRAKDEEQLMRLRKDKESDKNDAVDEIMDDDNISQIDLARALIASNEIDDAKKILKIIVETGLEDDKHEARLLFMQIK